MPIVFDLQGLLPLLNVQLRTHWAKRRREQQDLAWRVVAALHIAGSHRPPKPIDPARVTVERYCVQLPDPDNLAAGCKQILDVLCAPSPRHPCGLALIHDDAPAHCSLTTRAIKVPHRKEQRTRVTIEAAT